jgi:leader peptidase (prepilin peptidase) / N-methyltransferase
MVALVGACVGSFINVVAYRLPRECMSIAKPRSRCPRCSAPIAWYDNLPVVSWIFLRARCRTCQTPISFRYPLVEILTSCAFLAVAWNVLPKEALREPWEFGWPWLDWGVRCLITGTLIALALVDLDYWILPDQITKPGIVLGPLLAFAAPGVQPTPVIGKWSFGGMPLEVRIGPHWVALLHGVLGAVAAWATIAAIGVIGKKVFRKDAMGGGDVKLFAGMGGVLGFWSLLAFLVATFAGALIGILVLLARKGTKIPFGPFLAFGMWVVMLWGERVLFWWLSLYR